MREESRICDVCGHRIVSDQWDRMETANGKHHLTRHGSKTVDCGGRFVREVSTLVSRVTGER